MQVYHLVGTYIWFETWWRRVLSLFSWHNTLNSSNAICCLFRKDGRRVYVVYVCACAHVVWRELLIRHSPGKKGILQHKVTWVIIIWEEVKVLNELVKATLLWWAHSRENHPSSLLPPQGGSCTRAHRCTRICAYTHSRRAFFLFSSHGLPTVELFCPWLRSPIFLPTTLTLPPWRLGSAREQRKPLSWWKNHHSNMAPSPAP